MSAIAEPQTKNIDLNRHQMLMLSVPEDTSIADLAGRGCGKSYGAALMMLRGVEQYGRHYRALYVRQSYRGLKDFESILLDVFQTAYGSSFKYNQTEHQLTHPSGAYIELGEMSDARSYLKYQGRSFTEIYIDECQQWGEPKLIDLLRSNLRSAKVPTRMVLMANPLGAGHGWLKSRYVDAASVGKDFLHGGVKWVRLTGTYRDNELIDQEQYRENLIASTVGDKARRDAWLNADYDVDAGGFFAGCFNHNNVIDTDPSSLPFAHLHEFRLGHDWGYAAPAVTLLGCQTIDNHHMFGRYVPRGSWLLLDEHTTRSDHSLTEGRRLSIPDLSEEILEMVGRWPYAKPRGVADDAIASARGDQPRTFEEEFKRCGIALKPAKKGERVASLQRLVTLLANAHTHDDQPMLLVNRRCRYLIETLPMLTRSEKNPEDTEQCGFDHAVDAARYLVTPNKRAQTFMHVQRFEL